MSQDWSNPQVRPFIEEYPIRSRTIGEAYHSHKWVHEIDPALQAPMWADGRKHYYIGELAALRDGRRVVPLAWYRYKSQGEVYAEGYEVVWNFDVSIFQSHVMKRFLRLECTDTYTYRSQSSTY